MIQICSIACDIFFEKNENNFSVKNKCQIFSGLNARHPLKFFLIYEIFF